jgi:IPT/TIG domain-containing protein
MADWTPVAATVYTITPATVTVAGGVQATIAGPDSLAGTVGVDFGTIAALGFDVYDDQTLLVTVPPHAAATVTVTVHTTTGDISIPGGMAYTAGPGPPVDWPTLAEVRQKLRITGTDDDPVIDSARKAALDYGNRRTNYRWAPGANSLWAQPMTDAVHEAAMIHAARLYRRRDSTDGTVGWADVGLTHIGRADPDVEALYDLIGPLVFG